MEFRLLGSVEMRHADGSLLPVKRRKARLLLATLLLETGRDVSKDTLVTRLWGDLEPESAVQNLHTYLSDLRQALRTGEPDGQPRLGLRGRGYQLRVAPNELDSAIFKRLLSQARSAAQEGTHELAKEHLSQALTLWRGKALEGLELPDSLMAEANCLNELRVYAEEQLVDARLHLGEHSEVAADVQMLVDRHPLRERLWAQLMLALYRGGRPVEALDTYLRIRARMADELGVEPGVELRELHRQILARDPALMDTPRASTAATATTTNGPDGMAPVAPNSCLPRDIGDFVGRTAELNTLVSAARNPAISVMVSIIDGMPGAGKTTLALRAAHVLASEFPDGQLFLDLHGFAVNRERLNPGQALQILLRMAGVTTELPDSEDELSARWRALLAGRRTIVILDNAATPEQVIPLVPGTPGSLVLMTTRSRQLNLDGALTLALDVLPPAEAATLFTRMLGDDRAAIEPTEAQEVLDRFGGLPLAIRTAANWLRHRPAWTVGHLADTLREDARSPAILDAGARIFDAFSASYQYLDEDSRRLLGFVAQLRDEDFGVPHAARLAGMPTAETRLRLERLVDSHMLQASPGFRYRCPELVLWFTRATTGLPVLDNQVLDNQVEAHEAGPQVRSLQRSGGR